MPTKVIGRRVFALIFDGIIISVVNGLIFFALAGDPTTAGLDPNETVYGNLTLGDKTYSVYGAKAGLYFLIVFLIYFGYFVVWQGLRGVTLGKLMLGIRVVKADGSGHPPGVGRALARWFLFIADGFPYLIPYLTGFIVALVTKRNQRIGDLVASTLVIRRDSPPPADGPAA